MKKRQRPQSDDEPVPPDDEREPEGPGRYRKPKLVRVSFMARADAKKRRLSA
jgi:hypothetical protein